MIVRTWRISAVALAAALLGGCAPTEEASRRAAAGAPSTADRLLEMRIVNALQRDDAMHEAQIQVSVNRGQVRLSGFVANAAARLRATDLARQHAEGAAAVTNRLILRQQAGSAADPFAGAVVRL